MKISKFFEENYLTYARYDVIRKLASYIDGQKISSRKIIHVLSTDNSNEYIKTAQLGPRVADKAQYLHTETILAGVIANMVKDYPGSNNLIFLDKDGNFGSRFNNSVAAPRYTRVRKAKNFHNIFNETDNIICNMINGQKFEGKDIEPVFYMPTIPLVLVNGTEGIASGYAQKILPRKLKDILKEVKNYLNGVKMNRIVPYFEGYSGKIYFDEDSVVIQGVISKLKNNVITITEIPVTYDLMGYRKVLDKLLDDKKINDYKDLSDNDTFLFEIKVTKEVYAWDNNKLFNLLKLEKRVGENFTLLDENNSVVVFNNEIEILEKFIKLRLKYYNHRRIYILQELKKSITVLTNKLMFISSVIKKELNINNRKKDEIIKDLKSMEFSLVEGSYDYLFDLKVYNFTTEKITELKEKIEKTEEQYKAVEKMTSGTMWVTDLKELI